MPLTKGVSVKTIMVLIEDLKIDTYARVKLSEDRILHFAILFENNSEEVPAIEIAPDYSVTDGRHRIEGATMAGKTEIKCHIVPIGTKAEQLERAIMANTGGALPPTKADLVASIRELLRLGTPIYKAEEMITKIYPRSVAKKYVQEARHGIYRDKLNSAKREVLEGSVSVQQAAEKYEVKIDALKEELGEKKKKKARLSVGEIKKNLSTQFRSQGQKISNLMEKTMSVYDDGDMTKVQVEEIIDYFETYVKRQLTRIKEQRKRFESRTGV